MRNFFVVIFCIICSTTFAKVVAEGECGRHATWSLDDEGTLQIEGKRICGLFASRNILLI